MLTKERASELLATMIDKEWLDQSHTRLGPLRGKARVRVAGAINPKRWVDSEAREGEGDDGFAFLSADDIVYRSREHTRGVREAITGLTDGERRELIESLVPGKTWAVEAGWDALARRPLRMGWFQRPIRAPRHSSLGHARADWLCITLRELGPFKGSVAEVAAWLPHLELRSDSICWVLAGAIDAGPPGADVLSTLIASVRAEHEIGGPGHLAIRSLLCSNSPEAWDAVATLLLAARREEGLRQTILESVAFAHPGAFRRLCRVVLEERLCRFSAVVRAADVWFGLLWDSASPGIVEKAIESALYFLEHPEDRLRAVERGKPEEAYYALWSAAFDDVESMSPLALAASASARPLTRYAAAHVAACAGLPYCPQLLLKALGDDDLRVAARASDAFVAGFNEYSPDDATELRGTAFDALEGLLARVPGRGVKLKAALWPWSARELKSSVIADAMAQYASAENVPRLLAVMDRLSTRQRAALADTLGGPQGKDRWSGTWPEAGSTPRPIDEAARAALATLAADASAAVVGSALRALWNREVGRDERQVLFSLLRRTGADVRTLALKRAGQLPDDALLSFSRELLESSTEQQSAGLELLQGMVSAGRAPDRARAVASAWAATGPATTPDQNNALTAIAGAVQELPKREDAFGLVNTSGLTKPRPVRSLPRLRMTDAAWRCLASLAELIAANKARELPLARKSGDDEPSVLGAERLNWGIARPDGSKTVVEDRARCPIADLLEPWLTERAPETHDPDHLELLRALLALGRYQKETARYSYVNRLQWPESIASTLRDRGPDAVLVTTSPLEFVLHWAIRLCGDPGYAAALLESAEGAVAAGLFYARDSRPVRPIQRDPKGFLADTVPEWMSPIRELAHRGLIDRAPGARIWALAVSARPAATEFWARNYPGGKSEHNWHTPADAAVDPDEATLCEALAAGAVSEDDLLDYATHPYWSASGHVQFLTSSPLMEESGEDAEVPAHLREAVRIQRRAKIDPRFISAGQRLRERIIGLELARGDAPTGATPFARYVAFAGGAEVCIRCLAALGDRDLKRNRGWADLSRQGSLTHFVSVTLPQPADTPEGFASLAREAAVSDDTLITLGLFAPQWVAHVEHALGAGWAGFEEAVWWIHAHTKDSEYRLNTGLRKKWQAAIAERTPLQPDELRDGGVDVAWFARVLAAPGPKRWERVYADAKFATSGVGHKRVQLFADAMTGKAKDRELTSRAKRKRHQDSIRALGLVPLKAGDAGKAQVLARYKLMQEIRRTSRKHGGSMLQASEKRAVEIGMQNLARTAGYPDPLRLQWAMERLDLADLAHGPVCIKVGETKVALSLSSDGAPELSAEKKGKPLASVPAAARKDKRIAALCQRANDLRRSASRMRLALEQAMCRGDTFTAGELRELREHPILWSMLARLVLVGDGTRGLIGYPDKDGRVLRGHEGGLEPLKADDALRLAHPHDLLGRGDWHSWQRECFGAERVQPFKQVFRELYLPSAAEGGDARETLRYEGHQVQPRQALALLGSRSWVNRVDEGVQKTFYKERITARLVFAEHFYTPAEVEGLTLRSLTFTRAGKWEPLSLREVPPRVLSESLRDLDLVVSVAHRAGVDPEASRSTIEMRAALVRETAALLKLGNVEIDGVRARVNGGYAQYAVHLGSASVQVMPGAHLWIVPVGAQHRGRLFLPFADDDPRTAEVMSKVILLARDKEIRDPTIVEQIRNLT
jgi:hypothetical protein